MSENETYEVTVECANCGQVPKRTTPEGKAIEPFRYKIPKGMTTQEFLAAKRCPTCGCVACLRRSL